MEIAWINPIPKKIQITLEGNEIDCLKADLEQLKFKVTPIKDLNDITDKLLKILIKGYGETE